MPSPDELRAIAERAKEIIDRDCFGEPSIKQLETWTLLGKLADAVLEQQNRIEELERENERLRKACKLGQEGIRIACACCAQSPREEREITAINRQLTAVLCAATTKEDMQ